jgi:hypothetical protein
VEAVTEPRELRLRTRIDQLLNDRLMLREERDHYHALLLVSQRKANAQRRRAELWRARALRRGL